VKFLQIQTTSNVIVPPEPKPELLFIKTSSEEVGTSAPLEPPEVVDQWLVSLQFPVHQIQ
jgi:hypothetical protein